MIWHEPVELVPAKERYKAILDFPWELAQFERFVESRARAGRAHNDMFSEDTPRFEPRPEDLLVAAPELAAASVPSGIRLTSPSGDLRLEIPDLTPSEVTRWLGAMDGTRTAAELGWQSPGLERLLRSTFGLLVFAPAAVQSLERELSGAEITRFPSSPYAIVRPYWENMIALRRALEVHLAPAILQTAPAVEFLRHLHVIATMGSSLSSFYKPSSPVSDAGVMPGALWNVPARTVRTSSGILFVSGPRINASAPAGELYHRMIYQSVGDPAAVEPERVLADPDGYEWGQLMVARAAHDQGFAPWFCPPRPMKDEHFARLFAELQAALDAARRGERAATLRHAARFHWRFVHLHPFRCANQCLAMQAVNHVLRRILPCGLPHLLLDQLSVRLQMEAYERLFARAVEHFVTEEATPAARYAHYRDQKRLAFLAMQRIGESDSEAHARAALLTHPEAARAALLAME